MDENILDSTETTEEIGISGPEIIENDTSIGADDLEFVTDTDGSDSISSDISDVDETPVFNDRYDEEIGGYPVYIVNDELQSLSDDDVMLTASYSDYYSVLPTEISNYFSGVLANMGDTDYIAYYTRHYTSDSYSSYIDYFRLIYDIQLESGAFVSGDYPCIEISRNYGSNNSYQRSDSTVSLTTVPTFSYGSFGTLSDLRKGVSHDETYTFLFIAGFFICSFVLRNLFSCIRKSH